MIQFSCVTAYHFENILSAEFCYDNFLDIILGITKI
jgi:hypothetical protein